MSIRYAPSPTGELHVGNFRTAWVSYQWAKTLQQPWVVRFEDIDTPRVMAGSQQQQLDDLKSLGLIPDRIVVQSEKHKRHWVLFEKARLDEQIYPCYCSRKEVLSALASAPHLNESGSEALYSGQCRTNPTPNAANPTIAWRFKNQDESGKQDFIIARTTPNGSVDSFVPAYHWACAIDDWDDEHSMLVRGYDLASATPTQRTIQSWLLEKGGGSSYRKFPAVYHTAMVVANDGSRLEKRTRGVTLKELAAKGISPSQLIALFEGTLAPEFEAKQFKPERIWGESIEQMGLIDLKIL